MSKYKVIHGFALTNKRFLKKLEKYSAEGWHFKKYLFIVTLLERGEAKKYRYDLVYDKKFDNKRIEFYRAGGWEVLRNSFFWQIIRGEPGATDLYTDEDSEISMWEYRIKFTAVAALVSILVSLGIYLLSLSIAPNNEVVEFIMGMFFGGTISLMGLNIVFYIKYTLLKRRKEDG